MTCPTSLELTLAIVRTLLCAPKIRLLFCSNVPLSVHPYVNGCVPVAETPKLTPPPAGTFCDHGAPFTPIRGGRIETGFVVMTKFSKFMLVLTALCTKTRPTPSIVPLKSLEATPPGTTMFPVIDRLFQLVATVLNAY